MVATGTIIAASDFNTIQSLVNQVLGVNAGGALYGYGQNVSSAQVSQYAKITVTQWNNLRTDILRCRQHQTGTDLSASLTTPNTTIKLDHLDREAYLAMMQTAALDANRLITPPGTPIAQGVFANVLSTGNQVKTTPWNGTITQTVTVTFPGYTLTSGTVSGADHARCFFNAGGHFEISSSLTGGTSATAGTKDNSWATLLSGMGTIYLNRTNTTCTGTGTTYAVGWSTLTSVDQQIFQKDVGSGYTPNRYRIFAKAPSASQVIFTIYWEDLSVGTPFPNANPAWDVDENVTGTLTSIVGVWRPTGTNVTISAPDAVSTTL